MADSKGGRGNGGLLFVVALAVLSAAAIWFVEAERPRMEEARVAATRTQIVVARREATAQSRQTATTQARQTATTRARQAATTRSLQVASTSNAATSLAANARYAATAKTRTEIAQVQTSSVQTRTANERANRTVTTRANLSATAHANRTATARAIQNATVSYQLTATAQLVAVRARQTVDARARSTETAQARQAATIRAGRTGTAQAQYTATPSATPTPTTSLYRVNHTDGRVNIRECPQLTCPIVYQFDHDTELEGLRVVEGAAVRDETNWLEFSYQGYTLYVHLSLVEPVDGQGLDTASVQTAAITPSASPRPTTTPTFTATPPLGRHYIRNPGGGVNVRACPRLDCEVLIRWDSGRSFEVLSHVEGNSVNGNTRWMETRHSGQEAYVHSSLVTRTRPTSTPRPTNTPRPTRTPRPTNTPRPTRAPTRGFRTRETYYVSVFGGAIVRECPRLSCDRVTALSHRSPVTVVGEVTGEEHEGSRRWKKVLYGGRTVYIHSSLLSRNQPAPPVQENSGNSSGGSNNSSSSGGNSGGSSSGRNQRSSIPNCGGYTTSYISGYCPRVKRISGQCGFPRGDPNYTSARDRDGDGCACEC